jgi:hypothetical protein
MLIYLNCVVTPPLPLRILCVYRFRESLLHVRSHFPSYLSRASVCTFEVYKTKWNHSRFSELKNHLGFERRNGEASNRYDTARVWSCPVATLFRSHLNLSSVPYINRTETQSISAYECSVNVCHVYKQRRTAAYFSSKVNFPSSRLDVTQKVIFPPCAWTVCSDL